MYSVKINNLANRKIKKLSKKDSEIFFKIVKKLKEDPFQSSLKTHKLSGSLKGYYSCSITYSDRVIFLFLSGDDLVITDIGSHDDVY